MKKIKYNNMITKKRIQCRLLRTDPPLDITITTTDGELKAHRAMLMKYEYFNNSLDTDSNSIHLPFSSRIVDELLRLIYGECTTGDIEDDDMFRIMDFVGIHDTDWLLPKISGKDYATVCRRLSLYGKYTFTDPLDYFGIIKHLLIAACCISNEEFAVIMDKVRLEYTIARYICLLTKDPNNTTIPLLKNKIDNSRYWLPNYTCLRNINDYSNRAVPIKSAYSLLWDLWGNLDVDTKYKI
jgi:hypothetical protein